MLLVWRKYDNNHVRVWRHDWSVNQCLLWTNVEFEEFASKAVRLGVTIFEWTDRVVEDSSQW